MVPRSTQFYSDKEKLVQSWLNGRGTWDWEEWEVSSWRGKQKTRREKEKRKTEFVMGET